MSTCLHCGARFMQVGRGRPRAWCFDCLPAYADMVRRDYHLKARQLGQWRDTGIHYCCGERKLRAEPKAKPMRLCSVCQEPRGAGRKYCDKCKVDVYAEVSRQGSRKRRAAKGPAFLATRRRGWQKRRAMKRSVGSEPYNALDIAARDKWRCGLCGRRIRAEVNHLHPMSLTIDHVVPLSHGGADVAANVQAAHRRCNIAKGNRFTERGEQLRLVG